MLLKRTNIEDKLRKSSKKEVDPNALMQEVHAILASDGRQRDHIDGSLTKKTIAEANTFNFDLLETEDIYHLGQIKKICIDYRLRFLDTHYFKGEIPDDAIQKIKRMERDHGMEIKGLKIIAPSRLFRLKDKDDPLLFAPIGNGYYYLIHKWGNDLHPFRKLFAWPFKDVVNLIIMVMLGSYLITLLIPENLFSRNGDSSEFWIIYFFMFKSCAAIVLFYGFALGKNFNPGIWNSTYFNT
tara:strand:- start:82567 stop:83286 length:720 start_codon:yes stop_codon:yes gene_type:complete